MSTKEVLNLIRKVIESAELIETYLEDDAPFTAAQRLDDLEENIAYLRRELDTLAAKEDLSGSVVFLSDPEHLPALDKYRVDLAMDGRTFHFVDADACKATQLAVYFAAQEGLVIQIQSGDLDC